MNKRLQNISVKVEHQGQIFEQNLSYETFGCELYTAPIILINHALTGNSTVAGDEGWWQDLVGGGKAVDTNRFTIICFNIPGNGYDGVLVDNYKNYSNKLIAKLFLAGLKQLKISKLHAVIGGSLGGAIGWDMCVQQPDITKFLVPIATHWQASDWLIGHSYLQELILNNHPQPIETARVHAMLCYRTPQSLTEKFNRKPQPDTDLFQIESWLKHHGHKLNGRFDIKSYKLMNHLLKTIAVTDNVKDLATIQADIHMVSIDTDLYFVEQETIDTYDQLKPYKDNVYHHSIRSSHGHDGFLIEYKQLNDIMSQFIDD